MLNPRTDITAWKTIFSFPRRPEKMVFQKKIALEYGLSCIIGKDFFFLKIWSYPLDGKWKMISLKKICTNMIFSSNVLKRWSFKKNCAGIWSCMFLYYLERWYFFPKNLIFFLWAKNERWSFTRNTWKNDFLYICTGATNLILCLPLSPSPAKKNPKKAKMILSHKNTPKVIHILDRYPKNSFHNSLYFYGDLYRRFHILISSEKNQEP